MLTEKLLSITEVAKALGVKRPQVNYVFNKLELVPARLNGIAKMYPVEIIDTIRQALANLRSYDYLPDSRKTVGLQKLHLSAKGA